MPAREQVDLAVRSSEHCRTHPGAAALAMLDDEVPVNELAEVVGNPCGLRLPAPREAADGRLVSTRQQAIEDFYRSEGVNAFNLRDVMPPVIASIELASWRRLPRCDHALQHRDVPGAWLVGS